MIQDFVSLNLEISVKNIKLLARKNGVPIYRALSHFRALKDEIEKSEFQDLVVEVKRIKSEIEFMINKINK